jgi:hypothetical protein
MVSAMRLNEMVQKAKTFLNWLTHALASIKLAVCLIVVLAVVIAFATILETKYGRPYSQWFVYHSSWFIGLLGLLGSSVFSAAYVRFPWKRHQTGFVITHAGLLVLLSGSIITYWRGMEGQIVLAEGSSTDQLTRNEHSQITAHWANRPHERPYIFTFDSGPVDWRPGMTLDIGNVDGLSARVLRYYRRSQPVENWVADRRRRGGPMIRFQLEGPQGGGRVEHFLADQDYGAEVFVGPIAVRLQKAASEAMVADFLQPSDSQLGEKGVLTVYYNNEVQRVSVDQNVGQAVAIGNTGAKVELVQYLTNAKLDAAGQFQPLGEDLRNPLVELKVNLPGEEEPYRQVAFAKSPLLNFDGVYERDCPVKFVYQHPKINTTTAVEFLQAGDGKLFGRTIEGGKTNSQGELSVGDRLQLGGAFTFSIAEYLPHARRDISFRPMESNAAEDERHESAAAEVEIAIAGATRKLWLQRDHPEFQSGILDLPEGPLRVRFTTAQIPLGFSLELVEFKREMNPGKSGNAAYSSVVRVKDTERQLDYERLISMNQPLSHRGLRFYQSSFREAGHGKDASIFSVAYDPGRPLKYLGSLMVCLGIATMFYMRAYFFKAASPVRSQSPQPDGELPKGAALKVA